MKISLKWLSQYIEISDYINKPQDLADILTAAGLEVESIESPGQSLAFVVVGQILEKDKHPNADKLSLCRVTTGGSDIHQIVCGAKNHKAQDRVIVALPGAVLPGNLVIKKANLRGVESSGMLCSYKELALPGDSEGIAILPTDAPVGQSYAEYAGLNDTVLELKVTPNRADCLSHYGLARELSALLQRPLKEVEVAQLPDSLVMSQLSLDIKAKDLCQRYSALQMSGLRVGPSPQWLQRQIEKVGLTSINNIVDVTNYVMMELGQPLHAFDAKEVHGGLVIDRAVSAEKFVKLDGTEIELSAEDLTIRDHKRALCLAGVVGGKNSGVKDATEKIILESASFRSMSVRKTSRRHGIETDSAYRFSRGVDPEGTVRALLRAAHLILQVAGGSIDSKPQDHAIMAAEKPWIALSPEFVSQKLGYAVENTELTQLVSRLGCQWKETPHGLEIKSPSFRFDLEQDVDFVEEVARIKGYHLIPESLPATTKEPSDHDFKYVQTRWMKAHLRSFGFSEAWNYAFIGQADDEKILGSRKQVQQQFLPDMGEPVALINPLSEDLNVMRTNLTTGLLKNVFKNCLNSNSYGRLFEIGSVFRKTAEGYEERPHLAMVAWGQSQNLWDAKNPTPLVFEVKSALESFLNKWTGSSGLWKTSLEFESKSGFLHPSQWASIWLYGQQSGFIGSLHPRLLERQKVREAVAVAEIDLKEILQKYFKAEALTRRFVALSKFPPVSRDIALLMPEDMPVEKVLKVIKKSAGTLCQKVDVFDVYKGNELPSGQRSVAFRYILQDSQATLQEAQIQEAHQAILKGLQEQLGLSPR